MHRMQPLNDALALLSDLTSELKKHREEIRNDEVLAVQKETRSKIRQLMRKLEDLFPALQINEHERV